MRKKPTIHASPDWTQLLIDAVRMPGIISSAYQRFWNYSVGNQLLALFECMLRDLQPGPIHTFRGWLELGRHVKKGEKAITLCMPVTVKQKRRRKNSQAVKHPNRDERLDADRDNSGKSEDNHENITIFTYKPRWFVLSQTEGDPYVPAELPQWSEAQALRSLNIERVEFTHPNGNCQGFARKRQVSVSPIAAHPHETLFHELAHVVIGHTAYREFDDHDRTPKNLREVEAECVALICCESLGLPGAPECRGYIQHWLSGQSIPERSVQKIFKTADSILKAGYPPAQTAID